MAKRQRATKPKTPGGGTTAPDEVTIEHVVLLLVRGVGVGRLAAACAELGISRKDLDAALPEARKRITVAAETDHDEEFGKAVMRLNQIYATTVGGKDKKTALDAQRELNRLLGLYEDEAPSGAGDDELREEVAQAMQYLTPLGLTRKKAPTLSELCRLAAARIITSDETNG